MFTSQEGNQDYTTILTKCTDFTIKLNMSYRIRQDLKTFHYEHFVLILTILGNFLENSKDINEVVLTLMKFNDCNKRSMYWQKNES